MAQEPAIELRIVVGLCPRIMLRLGVDGETHISAALPQRVDQHLVALKRDDIVLCAVEGPDRHLLERADSLRKAMPPVAPATDRGDGREAPRKGRGKMPGSVAAHA